MKNYLTITFLCFAFCACAQQDTTTVYANPGYNKDPLRSNWIPQVEKQDSLWVLSLYNKKKVLQEKISYADEKLEVRKGQYLFFENGNLTQEGNYYKGYKHGEWKTYAAKLLTDKVNYAWGVLHGRYETYWDNGQVKQRGVYAKGKQIGNWNFFYKSGQVAVEQVFDDEGVSIIRNYFDQNGAAVKELIRAQLPIYPGGMRAFYDYVGYTLRYPAKAAKNNLTGIVKLQFLVLPNGNIDKIEVKESPDFELTQEAIRVLRNSGKWVPGKDLGEPVKMYLLLPIKFKLN